MAQGKMPDEELNGVTGGRGTSEAGRVSYYCSKVDHDLGLMYYLNLAGSDNDCPHFARKHGTDHHCLCCRNLEITYG